MKYTIFLPEAKPELKSKLTRLIDLSLETETSVSVQEAPLWNPDFFQVSNSPYWQKLSEEQKFFFLKTNSQELLKEAICIEHAGIAYAQKMGLTASTQEERHYYTCVANEEMQHLLALRPFCQVDPTTQATSFAGMISQIVQQENRKEALVLIQVLLEGWGISYYSSLMNGVDHPDVKYAFEMILRDESRHHAGGIILYQDAPVLDDAKLLESIQSLLDVVRIGPQQVVISLCSLLEISSESEIQKVHESIAALDSAEEKLTHLTRILAKILTSDQLQKLNFEVMSLAEMAQVTLQYLRNLESPNHSKEVDL